MGGVPRPALLLGLGGLIPFVYGAATALAPGLSFLPLSGAALLNLYGLIILCFMGGVLWGFAAKAGGGWADYAASVAPALLCIVPALFVPDLFAGRAGLLLLSLGFLGLLTLDRWFAARGLAPDWWMSLRALLTAVVVACLFLGNLG